MTVRPGRQSKADANPAFVGRDDALAAVVGALEDGPALVVVEGEPGIGKTRLLRECQGAPSLRERSVLVAACPALREPFPLGAIATGIRRLRPEVAELGLSPLGGALRPLFPEWTDALPPVLDVMDDPAETRHRLFAALTELVERLGVDVLVVEDAHWADSATLEWLLTLTAAEPATDSRDVSVVVSLRPADVPKGSLLPRLTSRSPAGGALVRVELEPLTTGQVRELVASMLAADEVSEQFAEFLYERTGGVPLAVEETVLLLRNREDIVRDSGGWSRRVLDELEVPPTIRDSVLERVDRLDPDARALLQAAAVVAEPADGALLTTVAELSEPAGRRGLAAALGSGLLQETSPGRFVFRHVLDAEAIGEAIPISERRRLHGRAGDMLEKQAHPPVTRLARHYKEAGEVEAWCRYAEQAADLALDSGDDRTAVTLLHELLTSTDHRPEQRMRLARKLGEAAVLGVTPLSELGTGVRRALQDVLDSEDLSVEDRGRTRLLLAQVLSAMSKHEAAFAEYEAAIAELAHEPALVFPAMLHLSWPLLTDHPASWHRAWLDRAVELLPQVEPPESRLWITAVRAIVLGLLGDEAGWKVARELPESGSTPAEQREIALGEVNLAQVAMVWGRYEEARRRLDAGELLVHATDYRRLADVARIARAHLDYYTGAWDGLAPVMEELADFEAARPVSRLEARLLQGLLALADGALGAAERYLREVSSEIAHRAHGAPFIVPSVGLARVRLAGGAAGGALAATESVMRTIATKGVWVWATDIAPVHVDALVAAGDLGQAEELVDRFAVGIDDLDAPAPHAALVTCRAIVTEARGDHDSAADLCAEAAAAWAGLPRPYDELLALEREGQALLAADRRDEATAVLSAAQQRLWKLGARWDADRLAQTLRQHGVEVARAWRGGRRGYGDQLSPREVEVVRLVARGMTNRQIAETLFISPRTVATQLRTVMRKLGASSRTAAALTAVEAGLLADDESD